MVAVLNKEAILSLAEKAVKVGLQKGASEAEAEGADEGLWLR